jgi:hypothetical protein
MYYPKSQIKSNLYTNGEEYVYASDKTVYTGYYYTTSDGKAFSGKEPNSGVNVRLISYSSTTGNEKISQPINSTSEIIRSTINATGDPFADDILYKNYVDNTSNYPKLKNFKPRKIPNQYLRRPQKEDVKLGGYNKFFTKKRTSFLYYEISEEDYNLLVGKDQTIAFDLYEGVSIFWDLYNFSLNKTKVSDVERDYKWYGFTNSFNDNFSTSPDLPTALYLYTRGNEFLLPNRTSYVGYYHYMSEGNAMTGKYHGEGSDITLIQIVSTPTPSSPESTSTETPIITTSTQTISPSSGGGGGY